ncbi:unnamed protein product [Prorocentrum cordatum]|uniref:Phosphoglycerate kinase n=1 Tax=Prorocentrum cordatum TaxID=2364126 RepID=A0ABN9PCX6_9DINO|nr:unnamed protein product [Polarella glacialis]
MGLCESCQAQTGQVGSSKAAPKEKAIYTGPSVWITSNGFESETQWVHFIQQLLKRKGVLAPEDESASVTRQALVTKYADTIKTLKMTYINDASFHRPEHLMAAGRDRTNPKHWFWWDNGMEDMMGLPRENIAMIQILEKPWLFNRAGRLANHDRSEPNVSELDPADEKKYFAALQLTQDAYNALKEKPPQVGAGQAGKKLPGCPASGLSCADELAEVSSALNEKYKDALDRWCTEYIDGSDFICGQGGEVVMLNMAWQCNQVVAGRLVDAVRSNKTVYLGLSASSMVAAKSMEMTGEIEPGWIEAFSAHSKHLNRDHFDENDLDGDGTALNVLGALPLFESPLAMRPHYSEAWEAEVLKKNLEAEKECEHEAGIEIDDEVVAKSNDGVEAALRLLNLISSAGNKQDNPVFVPLRNGRAFEVNIYSNPHREVFTVRN